jgi:hypothetical protein
MYILNIQFPKNKKEKHFCFSFLTKYKDISLFDYLTTSAVLVVSQQVLSTAVESTLVVSTAVESTVVVVSTVSVFLQDVKEIATTAITANNTFFIIFRFLIFIHDYISKIMQFV